MKSMKNIYYKNIKELKRTTREITQYAETSKGNIETSYIEGSGLCIARNLVYLVTCIRNIKYYLSLLAYLIFTLLVFSPCNLSLSILKH